MLVFVVERDTCPLLLYNPSLTNKNKIKVWWYCLPRLLFNHSLKKISKTCVVVHCINNVLIEIGGNIELVQEGFHFTLAENIGGSCGIDCIVGLSLSEGILIQKMEFHPFKEAKILHIKDIHLFVVVIIGG